MKKLLEIKTVFESANRVGRHAAAPGVRQVTAERRRDPIKAADSRCGGGVVGPPNGSSDAANGADLQSIRAPPAPSVT